MGLGAVLPCLWTLISLELLALVEGTVPLEDFYPFGVEHGDSSTGKQDDGGSGLLEISVNFPFFGDRHSGLYVNNNGLVSFLREVSQFTPVAFPIAGDRRVLAPFWSDVDNRRAGEVYYRESKDPAILQRATEDIQRYFPEFPEFTATWVLIATWHRVTFFGGSSFSPVNTFQGVLITDGELSFTIFQYEQITWTTGMHASSGGDFAGLGGIAAQAGFNAGDGKRYFNIPGSRTEDIVDVEETTNVGIPGRWVFRIDDALVLMGGCNDSGSVCLNLRPCLNKGRCIDDCITGNPSYTCSCPSGYTGKRCQIDVNECSTYPCQNGGSCIDGQNNFTCLCLPGFRGPLCGIDVNECSSQPCQNGGTCIDGQNSFTCLCPPGYKGPVCEIDMDECEGILCRNGGMCVEGVGHFTCVCEPGYTGETCETEIKECDSQPCLNGGQCIDRVNNYTCVCPDSFTGQHCETEVIPCEGDACLNRHTCNYIRPGRYVCTCSPGYYGNNCQYEEFEACPLKPCLNGGSCSRANGTAVCICPPGVSGEYCEEEGCLCQNGGSCTGINSTCECPSRFTGEYCQFEITQTPCSFNKPCPDGGPCMEYGGTYLCTCQTEVVERDIQPSVCDSGPCLNGGFCSERDGGYICDCKLGYRGKHCEKVRLSICASSPCRNGGSCREVAGGYHCSCPYRFTGRHCEIGKPDPCSSSPCGNGGTCFHYIGKYKCECAGGFTGRHCENALDPCLSAPCKNGGNCTKHIGGPYQCLCQPGYHGEHCEREMDCGAPVQVKHAQVQYTSSQPGSSALYTCHPGFTPVPRDTVSVCGGQGSWSQPPVCEEINECLSQPCLNGGTCKDRVDTYLCACEEGFTGHNCQTELDECLSEPCKHGGSCVDQPGSYFCQCPQGFTGQDCETELDGCGSNPCLNGGVCKGHRGSYLCLCKEGFMGEACQTAEDPCSLQPCGSRGYCRSDKSGQYICTCKVGHTGRDCEKELMPPAALQVVRVEEGEVEVSWRSPDAPQELIDGFAVTYTPIGGGDRKTDYLDKQRSTHLLRSLAPGRLYNITAFSVKRNANNNDISQPVLTIVRTRPRKVEDFHVANVSTSRVWLKWALHSNRHTTVSRVRVSLHSSHSAENITVLLNTNTTEHSFGSLLPGEMYTVDIVTQSGLKPEELPTVSQSVGPIRLWTRPLAPLNMSLSFITATTAQITWERPLIGSLDGYVINVTSSRTTKSRYLPNGKMSSYTVRELSPGLQYRLSLTAVRSTDHEQLHSDPLRLNITTMLSDERSGRRESAGSVGRGPQVVSGRAPSSRPLPTVQLDRENFDEIPRYTELIDGRGRITAKFSNLQNKAITHRARPESPIKLENIEETTNKISLALEIPEAENRKTEEQTGCKSNLCRNGGTCVKGPDSYLCECNVGFKGKHCELFCQRVPHPCTRLYSETKTIPVWEGGVCHYLYKRTYKVHQDICYREICEPLLQKKPPRDRRLYRHK
ncbi:sushi, nidogen and EGF-like domain-containing protein 1 isoform X3 [Acipenser ruthenus]|uniref:sushi, nidogen and EGF-like domain-containing protein 1 isoform X3 n=1 Tax=Acipenser ruthenus TaxID=7906 RepID=UPI00274036E9|nr:sushi, nidogen and EGF-like domain-containing protein 1 isoform X3 [Acipenser ruthenus]